VESWRPCGGNRSVVALRDNSRALSGGFDQTLSCGIGVRQVPEDNRVWTEDADDVFGTTSIRRGPRHCQGIGREGSALESRTGECLATLMGHSNNVTLPDHGGRMVPVSVRYKTVKIWDIKRRTCVGTLEGHQSGVDSVAISPMAP